MVSLYHIQNIRSFLTEGFNDEELRRLCYDVPEFRPVYDELAQTSGKGTIIDRLIEHAERKLLLEKLLALAQTANPARYNQHQPYQLKAEAKAEAETRERGVLVYCHCFGALPKEMPEQAYQLDWRAYFDSRAIPRRVPNPAIWRKTLLPQLTALAQEIPPPNQVCLRGSASLAAGFAFGQTFKEVARYGVEVEQFAEGGMQRWRSSQKGPPESARPDWLSQTLPGQPAASDGVVIILANPRQVLGQIVGAVGAYWDERENFEQGRCQKFRGVLILEAAATGQEKRHVENWEAVGLAQASNELLRQFIRQTQPKMLHLFLAVPLTLAVFLGHQWNALGKKGRCYEWVGGDKVYLPAGTLVL